MADLIERNGRLIERLPPIMQRFREMKEIMRTEDGIFDRMTYDVEQILNNAFIENCDEYGIRKYENLLSLVVSVEDTLETRKARVLLHWNNEVPYTYRVLIAKLNNYCGVNNYDVVSDMERYALDFNIYYEKHVAEVERLLEMILPLNIFYTIHVCSKHIGKNNIGILWQDDEIFTLRQVII